MNKPIYDPKNPKLTLEYEEAAPMQFELLNQSAVYGVAK
jgi:hypothetical protein